MNSNNSLILFIRTDTEYDDALIGKLFAFSFITSYASLFFIAFIKSNLGEACQGPCMAELAYQLTILIGEIYDFVLKCTFLNMF